MAVDKLSISVDADLAGQVPASAGRAGQSLSSWMAQAAAEHLRREALDAFFADYESEHGAFTDEELGQAREELGILRRDGRR